MGERMLVTEALDERDLLVRKIRSRIEKAHFVELIRAKEERVYGRRISREEFEREARASWQQIQDLMKRFQRISEAITASNASTRITTSRGTFTVAAALSLRSRMRGTGNYADAAAFEGALQDKLSEEYERGARAAQEKNRQLQAAAREILLHGGGKGGEENRDQVVAATVEENRMELVDPLDVRRRAEELERGRMSLLSELDTQIKISNATTWIEME